MTEEPTLPEQIRSAPVRVPRSRVVALIKLLGDDDPKIRRTAWEHLERAGEAALPLLEAAAEDGADPPAGLQARKFLLEWRRREVFRRWVDFCAGKAVELEEGAFLIARSEFPDADVASARALLDAYADGLRRRLATARSAEAAVRRLAHLLHEEQGFRGNEAEYYDPDNSYLTRVLERRLGIPLSLSVVYLCVARRLGIPLEGVGMPQHFLLRYRSSSGQRFVDAFRGGQVLTARDCARLLEENGIPFRPEYLEAVGDPSILSRMLANLLRIYEGRADRRRARRIGAMLRLLE